MPIRDARRVFKQESPEAVLAKRRARIAAQPRTFIENYLYIKDKNGVRRKLQFNWSQNQFWKVIEEQQSQRKPIRIITVKARQVGISTICCGLLFARQYSRNNRAGLIVGNLESTVATLFDKQKYFIANLDPNLALKIDRNNQKEIAWGEPSYSSIKSALANTASAARSHTLHDVFLTEAGFYRKLKEFKGGMEAAVPQNNPDTMIIMESTANGVGTDYHELWLAASENETLHAGEVPYRAVFLEWFKDPQCQMHFDSQQAQDLYLEEAFGKYPDLKERQAYYGLTPQQTGFYYRLLKNSYGGDTQILKQEFPCSPEEAFIAGGQTVFPMHLVDQYKHKTYAGKKINPQNPFSSIQDAAEDTFLRKNEDLYMEVWKNPQPGRIYLISADSSGLYEESDPSAAYVFDVVTQNIVAAIHGRVNPQPFAKLLAKIGTMYNDAVIVPEVDGVGIALLEALKNVYYNIYQQRKDDGYGIKITNRLGWETTLSSKQLIIRHARQLLAERVNDGKEFLPDKELINEFFTFVYDNRTMRERAKRYSHDDRVMAWMIGLYTCYHVLDLSPEISKGILPDALANRNKKERILTADDYSYMLNDPRWYGQKVDDNFFDLATGPIAVEEEI